MGISQMPIEIFIYKIAALEKWWEYNIDVVMLNILLRVILITHTYTLHFEFSIKAHFLDV